MKPDERAFLIVVSHLAPYQKPRDYIEAGYINHKRAVYLLEKWTAKRWYDYGVCVDLGWLTQTGFEEAERIERESKTEQAR